MNLLNPFMNLLILLNISVTPTCFLILCKNALDRSKFSSFYDAYKNRPRKILKKNIAENIMICSFMMLSKELSQYNIHDNVIQPHSIV